MTGNSSSCCKHYRRWRCEKWALPMGVPFIRKKGVNLPDTEISLLLLQRKTDDLEFIISQKWNGLHCLLFVRQMISLTSRQGSTKRTARQKVIANRNAFGACRPEEYYRWIRWRDGCPWWPWCELPVEKVRWLSATSSVNVFTVQSPLLWQHKWWKAWSTV